jgi:hypothetical protein
VAVGLREVVAEVLVVARIYANTSGESTWFADGTSGMTRKITAPRTTDWPNAKQAVEANLTDHDVHVDVSA